mmetsp:Transcript_6256/g.12468  ORF Transcript_6256/g.12468 Transcript_6256/m.12468 type:complete len:96 (+) Transcript_6256:1064-1351(+)
MASLLHSFSIVMFSLAATLASCIRSRRPLHEPYIAPESAVLQGLDKVRELGFLSSMDDILIEKDALLPSQFPEPADVQLRSKAKSHHACVEDPAE